MATPVSPVTLRLSSGTRQKIARIARRKRVSASDVMREAIESFVEKVEKESEGRSVYDDIKDLVGVVHGGDPHRSVDGGRKFAEYLKARRGRT